MKNRFKPDVQEEKKTKPEQVLRFGMFINASGVGLEFLESYRLGLINQLMITEAEIVRHKLLKQQEEM